MCKFFGGHVRAVLRRTAPFYTQDISHRKTLEILLGSWELTRLSNLRAEKEHQVLEPHELAMEYVDGQTVAKPTFSPPNYSGCKRWKDVTICSTTPGARIYVWWGAAGGDMSNCGTINVGRLGTIFLQAYAYKGSTKSGNQSGTLYASLLTQNRILGNWRNVARSGAH